MSFDCFQNARGMFAIQKTSIGCESSGSDHFGNCNEARRVITQGCWHDAKPYTTNHTPHPNDGKADAHGVWKDLVPEDLRLSTPTKPQRHQRMLSILLARHQNPCFTYSHIPSLDFLCIYQSSLKHTRSCNEVDAKAKGSSRKSTKKNSKIWAPRLHQQKPALLWAIQRWGRGPNLKNALPGSKGSLRLKMAADFVHFLGGQRNF